MRWLYILLSWLAFWLVVPFLSVFRKTRDGFRQRLGFYPYGLLPAGAGPRIWLHGASAGDLLALLPMITRLRLRFPAAKIIVSTITNTGFLMARERMAKHIDAVVYAPWDTWGATRRAARAIAADLLVLEYAEIWPNLIRAAKRSGAHIGLTNGRFSPRNLGRYHALFRLIENPLLDIDVFLMREDDEAERAIALGAPPSRVLVTGNTKFDALAPAAQSVDLPNLQTALGLTPDARVWILGSTHEGEEEALIGVYRRLLETAPDLWLIIAPRYLERADRVRALAEAAGLTVALRSKGNAAAARVIVLDSIGELTSAYRLATIVFVGGSFTSRGGQNILEPAAQGKPVLFGPHMENFRDSVQVLVGRGGIQVNDADHLTTVMRELLTRPSTIDALGEMARAQVRQVSGASDRNVQALAQLLGAAR